MNEAEFKRRTKAVGIRVMKLVDSLTSTRTADVIGRQVLRSGFAIGANYRAACRSVSRRDMIAKLGHVEEEADETLHWPETLIETNLVSEKKLRGLMTEVNEILAMVVASTKTLRIPNPKSKNQNPKSHASP